MHKVLIFVVLAAGSLRAQATFGSITGTVTDPAGGVVPNAAVQVTNQETGLVKSVVTDSFGNYEVTHLNPGVYSVMAQAPGFKKLEHRDIVLEALRSVRVNAPLEVGDIGAEVTVSAGTPVVETESSTIASIHTGREMRDLPLNFVATSGLLTTFTSLVPTGYLSLGAKFAMGGARGTQLYYSIDGVSANSPLFGVQNSFAEPSLGSVSEMRFDLVNNRAEFGEVTTATVITKSGTNQLHGRLFWMNTTAALNARPYFSPSKAQNIINDFGVSVGGPVIHNKTFFFGTFEGLRQSQSTIVNPSLPTLKMRRGDFSELLARNPATIIRDPSGQPYPGNIIPADQLNPAALKWQERFFPLPNFGPPDLFVANFRAAYPSGNRQDQFDIRMDHYFSPRNTFYARVSYRRNEPHALDSGLPPDITGYRVQVRNGRLAAISDTWTISPNLINEFKAGFSRNLNPRGGVLKGQELIDFFRDSGIDAAAHRHRQYPQRVDPGFPAGGTGRRRNARREYLSTDRPGDIFARTAHLEDRIRVPAAAVERFHLSAIRHLHLHQSLFGLRLCRLPAGPAAKHPAHHAAPRPVLALLVDGRLHPGRLQSFPTLT